jgi:hypothetical protein
MKQPNLSRIREGVSYKYIKIGIQKNPDYEYYVDEEGDISYKDLDEKSTKVIKAGIKKIPELYYYVDDDGDVSVIKGAQEIKKELRKEEEQIARLFALAGFKVTHNANVKGHKVDILCEKGQYKILCIEKYENSEISVRDDIVRWVEKNNVIKADKMIFAIFGIEVLGEDRAMAETNDVLIFEEDNIKELLTAIEEDKTEGTKRLLGILGIEAYSDPHIKHEHTMDY